VRPGPIRNTEAAPAATLRGTLSGVSTPPMRPRSANSRSKVKLRPSQDVALPDRAVLVGQGMPSRHVADVDHVEPAVGVGRHPAQQEAVHEAGGGHVRVTGAEGDRPVDAHERQAPDSSAAALTRALGRPLDGLETDCCLTADGELVLLHDPRLEVGTTVSGWAHERTAAQIRAGRLRHRDGTPSDERPLLLDELLELAPPGATLQLEVEAHADPALARRTARASGERLRDHPAHERTEVIRSGPVHASWPPSSAFGRGWSLSPIAASTRSSPGGDASASTADASSTFSSRARWSQPSERSDSASRPAPNHAAMLEPLLPLGLAAVTSDSPHQLHGALSRAPVGLPLTA
jgi:hypothetical protein